MPNFIRIEKPIHSNQKISLDYIELSNMCFGKVSNMGLDPVNKMSGGIGDIGERNQDGLKLHIDLGKPVLIVKVQLRSIESETPPVTSVHAARSNNRSTY
jgi:hypothetical protein